MRNADHKAGRIIGRFHIVLIAVVVLGAVSYGLLHWYAREKEERVWREYRETREALREELDALASLDERERAERTWAIWIDIVEKRRPYAPGQYGMLMTELQDLGAAAIDALVEEIRHGAGMRAHEAAARLSMFFDEKATHALIEIVQTESGNARSAALTGLWYRTCSEITDDERQAVEEALAPLLDSPEKSLREEAENVLNHLRD